MINFLANTTGAFTCATFDSLPILAVCTVITPIAYQMIYKTTQVCKTILDGSPSPQQRRTRCQDSHEIARAGLVVVLFSSMVKPSLFGPLNTLLIKIQHFVKPLFLQTLNTIYYLANKYHLPDASLEKMGSSTVFLKSYNVYCFCWIVISLYSAYKIIQSVKTWNTSQNTRSAF